MALTATRNQFKKYGTV